MIVLKVPFGKWRLLACAATLVLFGAQPAVSANSFQQCGKASWYKLGGTTASGERANPHGLTAAHRSLPFGTMVEVTNLSNGKSVTVRINDRGPFAKGRVIDVTLAAAKELEFVGKGITRVRVSGKSGQIDAKHTQKCR
ncbi:MAG: septal ring lytic transglycosylase RlpA family protein [Roseibium sp.]|uniref:septal ring lytic transglycosylase RlpA family protein n=1 Tax=Roseibium sp. TaxID=1936156 RepID=UPI002610EAA9|nr:septal ring lytic transglycosylase RlpA family protein [Roseibium sp.]MCV0429045.1 septal ring lytic transglycosylase RlpA family protein [Roseibium sp.]